MTDSISLSSALISPTNEALAYRELRAASPAVDALTSARAGISGAEQALGAYLSGSVPEKGRLPAELINRMIF